MTTNKLVLPILFSVAMASSQAAAQHTDAVRHVSDSSSILLPLNPKLVKTLVKMGYAVTPDDAVVSASTDSQVEQKYFVQEGDARRALIAAELTRRWGEPFILAFSGQTLSTWNTPSYTSAQTLPKNVAIIDRAMMIDRSPITLVKINGKLPVVNSSSPVQKSE